MMRGDQSGAVLKSGEDEAVRPIFGQLENSTTPVGGDEGVSRRSATVELMEKLALCEAQIAGHQDALDKAFREGEEAGRAAAEDAFEDDRKEALSRLERGIDSAQKDLAVAFEKFEALALQAANTALHVLIADDGHYSKIFEAAIARQVAAVRTENLVEIIVSRSDFPDSRETDSLAAKLGIPEDSLRISDELNAGQCHFALKIGGIEFDLQKSVGDIAKVLSHRTDET